MADWYTNNYKSKGHIAFGEGPTLPYSLELHRVDGLSKLKSNIEISISFYDAVQHLCYGSTWRSLSISPPFNINQELVFHSEVTPSSMILLEIIQIDAATYKKVTLGWTCFKLLDDNVSNKKLDIYHGSLRAIFFFKEPSIAHTQLLRREGVALSLTLSQRNVVQGIRSHLPPNYLHYPAQLNKINKTIAPLTIFLENVEVFLDTHIKKFEDNIMFLLMADAKQQNTNIRQFDKVTIKERRLKASIHNGLNFTDQFQVVYLENVQNANLQCLKSKGVISLSGLDARNHVIFSLEYVLEVPISFTNLTLVSSMRQSQVQIVSLRWGVWSLSKNLPPSGAIMTVPIIGGPGLNPEKKLVFTSDFGPANQFAGTPTVNFKLIKQEAGDHVVYRSRDTLDMTYQDTGVQMEHSGPLRTTLTDTQESFNLPTIDQKAVVQSYRAAQEPRPVEPLVRENTVQYDIKPQYHQDISQQDIEKATYAQIHNAGFPDVVDSDGRPAIELDLSKHYIYSPGLENNDPRTCNTVVFQFLAVSFNKTFVRNMFFTVQFYCFVAETTPILSAQPSKQQLPAILHKQADPSPGCIVSFKVDPGKCSHEPGQFLDHIQAGSCIIDLWNADSLFHEGSVTVKLKRLARQGEHGVQTTHVFNILSNEEQMGKLHLRIANIGSIPNVYDVKDLETSLIIDCLGKDEGKELIVRPKPLSNVDQNLTSILASQSVQKAARSRKLERLEAVRREEDASYILPRDENRALRAGQLTMVSNYRNKILNDVIRDALVSNITRHHTLYTVYGTVSYFELHVTNTTASAQDYWVSWDADDIRLVYNTRECKALKSLFNITTPLDPGVFSSTTRPVKLTLRSREDIYIPFLYNSNATKQEFNYTMKLTNESNSPIQLIKLHFKQQRQIINERFMFYEAENSFAKHTLAAPGAIRTGELTVKCSNENVLCNVDSNSQIFFKAPVPKSTEMLSFLLLLYVDRNCYRPYQIWEVNLYSLKRVDMSAVVGTQTKFPVILRGTDTVRCVTCFSSQPPVLQVEPDREFMLLPSTIQEVKLLYEPTETGVKNYMVNVVDTKNRLVVERWMVHTAADLPIVSKTYDIPVTTTLSPTHKNISFSNPYSSTKIFRLKTNLPELVSFKEQELSIPSKESVNLGLILSPLAVSHPNYILVFVNDVDQKCEECFALRIGS